MPHRASLGLVVRQGTRDALYATVQRSSCQPREVLVNILKEHPQETADFFKPSCVVLQQCAGCCNDDSLKCFAVTKRSVSLQIMRVNPNTQTLRMEWMNFMEHLTCECRPWIVNRTKNRKSRKRKGTKRKGSREPDSPLSDQPLTPAALGGGRLWSAEAS